MPVGASVTNGIIASLLIIIAPFIPNENIFWAFFSLNVVALLLSYIMMFPAFLKLRKSILMLFVHLKFLDQIGC